MVNDKKTIFIIIVVVILSLFVLRQMYWINYFVWEVLNLLVVLFIVYLVYKNWDDIKRFWKKMTK